MASNLSDSQGYILRETKSGWDSLILAEGKTVPADASTGYGTGCVFIHVDGGSATAVYINIGSSVSANFDPIGVIPLNVSSLGAGNTILFLPTDTTGAGVTTLAYNIAGRIAVQMPTATGTGSTMRYIPVMYGS